MPPEERGKADEEEKKRHTTLSGVRDAPCALARPCSLRLCSRSSARDTVNDETDAMITDP